MNKKAQNNIEGIIGSILGVFVLVIFLSAMIPIFSSLNGNGAKQKEIDGLKNQILNLNQEIATKEVKISELQSNLDSIGKSLNEKDLIISNLTGQINEKDRIIKNLTDELSYLKEKDYLQDINNNYYNISNYFEKIENQFFPINLSISLISFTLFALILKEFGVISFVKRILGKNKRKENKLPDLN